MENKVKVTNKYWIFKTMKGNREVNISNKLLQSIKEKGILQPILVNNDMEVIDGQHRLAAARILGREIPYIVVNDLKIEDCLELNTTQSNWKLMDYVKSLAERGDIRYIRIQNLMNRYDVFGLKIIGTAINLLGGLSKSDIMKDKINVDEQTYLRAIDKLDFVESLYKEVSEKRHIKMNTYMLQAIIKIYDFEEINKDRLFNKVAALYDEDSQMSSIDKSVKILEEMYNLRNRRENYVYIFNLYERNKRK